MSTTNKIGLGGSCRGCTEAVVIEFDPANIILENTVPLTTPFRGRLTS